MSVEWFVDTNILVYARDASESDKQPRAMAWLRYLWRSRAGGLSTQVLSEYYVTVTRKLSHPLPLEEAWNDVLGFMAWRPLAITGDILVRARAIQARHAFSWWDASIMAAAVASGASALLTEDLQEGQMVDGVRIVNPFHAPPPRAAE